MATELAKESTFYQKHGAIVVRGGSRILGQGINKCKNDPRIVSALKGTGHCTTHAEVSAVKSCRGSVEGATIYVARVSRDGQRQMMSKPCKACQKY